VDGFRVGTTGCGLMPPTPSSVAPIGIPIRPTVDREPIPLGDEADPAGPAKELPAAAPAQVPDAVPAMLPPSKVELDVPALDVPMPDVVPVPVLAAPKDACGSEPPMPLQVVRFCIVCGSGDAPDVVGLTPSVGTWVAPRRRPVGGTGAPGPMPSGDVMPSGEGPGVMPVPPTCAKAEPLKRAAAMVAITKRVIIGSTLFCIEIMRGFGDTRSE
jgi:hypothetical protein